MREFKPALLFLFKFLGIYVVGNIIYGLYISYYYPKSDPVTKWISDQVGTIITASGTTVTTLPSATKATISLVIEPMQDVIINVFEGCNGINVAIIFLAFIIAYQGTIIRTLIFTFVGLFVIHVFNLARIILLFQQAKDHSPYFYYIHKYLFTAILYAVVLVLWWFWVSKVNGIGNDHLRKAQVE